MAHKTHTAPYGFVPLNEVVVHPSWAQPIETSDGMVAPPLQDLPFKDGICGEVTVELEAETPIFVRGAGRPKDFFAFPDGRYAIPATGLRGALRNVVEIASFARMRDVNDHRYAVRDLHNRHLYGKFMADIVYNNRTNKREPTPLVNAGWLRQQENDGGVEYSIEVCDFAKIEYGHLERLARSQRGPDFRPGKKQSAVSKYKAWGERNRELDFTVRFTRPTASGLLSNYGRVRPNEGTKTPGTLVFTGQPSNYRPPRPGERRRGQPKHHDFVFFKAARTRRLPVKQRTFDDFEFAHSDRGQQNSLNNSQNPNEEWGYWRERLRNGEKVPVFFLCDKGSEAVRAFGLAMMFRLPYKHSIGDAIRHAQGSDDDRVDFGDAIFGTVRELQSKSSTTLTIKGRVDFSHAMAQGSPTPMRPITTVLGAPKASYYPNYVEQNPDRPGSGPQGKNYVTWQDDGARPRGWKRYRVQREIWTPQPPTGSNGRKLDQSKVETTFCPLPEQTRFRFSMYVHNLKPVELGALLWALDFGGDPEARHALGMARPLGFGCVAMKVVGSTLTRVDGEHVELHSCVEQYERFMEESIAPFGASWANSVQILELKALAQPASYRDVSYQRLDPGARRNDFVQAKKAMSILPRVSRGGEVARRPTHHSADAKQTSAIRAGEKRSPAKSPHQVTATPAHPRSAAPAKLTDAQKTIQWLNSNLGPGCAAQVLPEAFKRAQGDAALTQKVVETAVAKLKVKWLKKKTGKAWLKPLMEHFAQHGHPLT